MDLAPIVTGLGSESLVFVLPKPDTLGADQLRDVVLKVNYQAVEPMVRSLMIGDAEKAERERLKMIQSLQTRRRERKELQSYVGSALVREHTFVRDVPVTDRLIRDIFRLPEHLRLRFPSHLAAPVTIQPRIELATDQKGFTWMDATDQYPEVWYQRAKTVEQRDTYERVHDVLIGRVPLEDRARLLEEIQSFFPSYEDIIDTVRREESAVAEAGSDREELHPFTSMLREFIPSLIRYANEQGVPVDFAGSHNVVFIFRQGKWQTKMIDPFPIERIKIRDLELIIEKMKRQRTDPDDEFELKEKQKMAMQILHSVRTLNALAILAGIPDRVEVKGLVDIPADVWAQGISAVI